jgi:hypothetical protein
MHEFKVGDYVYVDDWCYGQIVDISEEGARVEFDTPGGGGSYMFDFDELEPADPPLVYTHNEELNEVVTALMDDWKRLVAKAKFCGMDIRFAPNCENPLELYFHDDYPNMLLVDKEVSCVPKDRPIKCGQMPWCKKTTCSECDRYAAEEMIMTEEKPCNT